MSAKHLWNNNRSTLGESSASATLTGTDPARMAAMLEIGGKGTLTINSFLCDVSVAAGGHVDLYRPYPTNALVKKNT